MKKEKAFLFITFTINCGYIGPTLSAVYLTSIAKKHGYRFIALNIPAEIDTGSFCAKVLSFSPSIIGYSCVSTQFKYLIKYSKKLERFIDILQIAGGAHPTLNPDEVLLKSGVNGVCVGEGERPLDLLLTNIEKQADIFATEGFFWKKDGVVIKNPVPQFVTDLSSLELPDYSIIDKNLIMNVITDEHLKRTKQINCVLGRGCSYACYYCCSKAMSDVYPSSDGYWRLPTVAYSIKLLKSLIKSFPETEYLSLDDDLLISDEEWFKRFAIEYKKEINLPYRVHGRPEFINPAMVRLLRESGCDTISFGLESGNERFRRTYLNRHYSNESFIEKINIVKDSGIKILTYNIVGFPFETKSHMQETLELNRKIAPFYGFCVFFYPFKGTRLYDICKKANLLLDEKEYYNITNYNSKPSIRLGAIQRLNCIYYNKIIAAYLMAQRFKYTVRAVYLENKDKGKMSLVPLFATLVFKGMFHAIRTFCGRYMPENKRWNVIRNGIKEWKTLK